MEEINELIKSVDKLNLKEECKDNIVEIFRKNVKEKKFLKSNNKHNGSEGQWLEKSFGILNNSENSPDIGGYLINFPYANNKINILYTIY